MSATDLEMTPSGRFLVFRRSQESAGR